MAVGGAPMQAQDRARPHLCADALAAAAAAGCRRAPARWPLDAVARVLAPRLSATLDQSLVVENGSGSGSGARGAVGAEFAARAEPNGHPLFVTSLGPGNRLHHRGC